MPGSGDHDALTEYRRRRRAPEPTDLRVLAHYQWIIAAADDLAARVAALEHAVEAARRVEAWEHYDPDYADDAMRREHDADYAALRDALAGLDGQ